MKSFRSRATTLACLLTCATWSLGASAQYESLESTDDGYQVTFKDGDVLSDREGANGWVFRIPPAGRRVLLIRPRASFVGEMLKSVEHM